VHILFLTDNFPPEVVAPASRTYEHCCEWVRQGAKVTVITCAPNFYMRYRTQGPIAGQHCSRTVPAKRMLGILKNLQRRNQ